MECSREHRIARVEKARLAHIAEHRLIDSQRIDACHRSELNRHWVGAAKLSALVDVRVPGVNEDSCCPIMRQYASNACCLAAFAFALLTSDELVQKAG